MAGKQRKPTKDQHFVPQFYLRKFRSNESKDPQGSLIWSFDKRLETARERLILEVAYERWFYDWRLPGGIRVSYEKTLEELEKTWAKALAKICAAGSIETVMQYQGAMMTMVACQLLRTTATRQLQREVETILNAVDEERLGGKIVGASDADMAASHVRLMHWRMPQTALVLFQMRWVLLVNDTATPFWTSDNPVVQHNALGGDIGLLNRGIEVHIPLSPRLSLVLHDPNTALPPYGQCPATDRQVMFENKLQVTWSRRFVFSPNSTFGAAQRLLAQYPNWRYPDRPQLVRVT